MNMQTAQPANEPPAATDLSALERDVLDVFAFDEGSAPGEPAPANEAPAAPAAASEPGGDAGQAPVSPPAPSESPAAPAAQPVAPQPAQPAAPAQGAPPPAAPSPAPTPAAATPPAPDEQALRAASLEAQVAALQSQLQELRANPPAAQPAQSAAPGPDSPQGEQPLRYNLSLPEQVTNALIGEDPTQANQAIHWIVNSLATVVHNNLRQEYRQHFDNRVNALVAEAGQASAEEQQARTVEQAREQYYGRFPDHKNPLISPLVASEAQKLAAQYPHLTWGEEYMNTLGARVNHAIATLRGQPAQPAQPAAPTPPLKPAGQLPAAGPRPMIPVGGESQEDIIYSTMQEGSFW